MIKYISRLTILVSTEAESTENCLIFFSPSTEMNNRYKVQDQNWKAKLTFLVDNDLISSKNKLIIFFYFLGRKQVFSQELRVICRNQVKFDSRKKI
jgi:hypothetical protein